MDTTTDQGSFKKLTTLTGLVYIGLILFALLDMMNIPAGILGMYGVGTLGEGVRNEDLIEISMLIRGLSALGQLAMFVYMAICFGMLMYRFAANARTLGFTGFSHSPGWVVGWYYVPFAHLIMPYKAIVEVWQASKTRVEPGVYPEWHDETTGVLLKAWWAAWIFGTITNNAALRFSQSDYLESFGMTLTPFAAVLQVLSAVLCIIVVSRLASGQMLQAKTLGLVGE